MKIHYVTKPDGTLSIISLSSRIPLDREDDVVSKAIFEMTRDGDMSTHFDPLVHTVRALPAREGDDVDLPTDRYFRDAWEDLGAAIDVNMPKAQEVHMGYIRRERDIELAKQDIEYMKALESGNTGEQTRIAALKQTLRDLPSTFDLTLAPNPTALKALWPPELVERGL